MNLIATILTGVQDCGQAALFGLRTDSNTPIFISSGDPDPSTSAIRRSGLGALSKLRASEILREARATGNPLAEDLGVAGDGGLIMEFSMQGREIMITVSTAGGWTYFSAAVEGKQTAAGILRDDGIKAAIRWVAGLEKDLSGPGVIAG